MTLLQLEEISLKGCSCARAAWTCSHDRRRNNHIVRLVRYIGLIGAAKNVYYSGLQITMADGVEIVFRRIVTSDRCVSVPLQYSIPGCVTVRTKGERE